MAGQEGLEPPTIGFGDRRSTIGATDLCPPQAPLAFEFNLFMRGALILPRAKFFELQFFRVCLGILGCAVIDFCTICAFQTNLDFHAYPYSRIFVTTPAPTVLPPSRMANFVPTSRAIELMSSTTILVLSPGMIISVPSGKVIEPVTSVVRT